SALNQALTASVAAGITWVVPAGDDTQPACSHTPSSLGSGTDGLITVGATDSSDAFVATTSGGPCVDLYAPGQGVDSLYGSLAFPLTGPTRPATAYTAGVVAQYLQIIAGPP